MHATQVHFTHVRTTVIYSWRGKAKYNSQIPQEHTHVFLNSFNGCLCLFNASGLKTSVSSKLMLLTKEEETVGLVRLTASPGLEFHLRCWLFEMIGRETDFSGDWIDSATWQVRTDIPAPPPGQPSALCASLCGETLSCKRRARQQKPLRSYTRKWIYTVLCSSIPCIASCYTLLHRIALGCAGLGFRTLFPNASRFCCVY